GESWNEPQESQERGALLRLQRAIVIRIKMRECDAQSSGLRRRHRDWIDSVRKKPVDDADRLRPVKRGGVFETRNRNQQEQQRHFIGGLLTVGYPPGRTRRVARVSRRIVVHISQFNPQWILSSGK